MKGRAISQEEFTKMLSVTEAIVGAAAKDSWIHVLEGLWSSAFRLEELMNLSWDIPGTIRPIWTQNSYPVILIPAELQKNNTEETIPLLPWFESLLDRTPSNLRHGWIFRPQALIGRKGASSPDYRPKSDWVGKVISRIGKKASVIVAQGDERTGRSTKYASAHDLRRSCSERMRNSGVPPLIICRILRHVSWETLRKFYAVGEIQSEASTLRGILGENK